jgi:DNA-binding MarR family transcriptional regulator
MLSRSISRAYDAALRPHAVTVAQLNILATVGDLGPAPSGEIAAALWMEISTLSRNVRLMAGEGWIKSDRTGRGNGRILRITDSGLEKLNEVLPAWREAQSSTRDLLGAQSAAQIAGTVDRIWLEGAAPAGATRRGQ